MDAVRLTELEPKWIGWEYQHSEWRFYFGITFLCPHCKNTRLGTFFRNPVDPNDLVGRGLMIWTNPPKTWAREGDTFATLSISPSIDVSAHGHWHGSITNGEVT